MPPSLPPLPTPLQTTLRSFRPLFHATTWLVFLGVLTGLLTGHTTLACVRASLLCADVSWQQCCLRPVIATPAGRELLAANLI